MNRLYEYLEKWYYGEAFIERKMIKHEYMMNLYKNPQTFKNMEKWARGIILPNGDLYMMSMDRELSKGEPMFHNVIHPDLVKWLANKGILSTNAKSFNYEKDNPSDWTNEFILVERIKNTETIGLSESYDMDDIIPEVKKQMDKILDKAKAKHKFRFRIF